VSTAPWSRVSLVFELPLPAITVQLSFFQKLLVNRSFFLLSKRKPPLIYRKDRRDINYTRKNWVKVLEFTTSWKKNADVEWRGQQTSPTTANVAKVFSVEDDHPGSDNKNKKENNKRSKRRNKKNN
jgi:trehalose utilization protein